MGAAERVFPQITVTSSHHLFHHQYISKWHHLNIWYLSSLSNAGVHFPGRGGSWNWSGRRSRSRWSCHHHRTCLYFFLCLFSHHYRTCECRSLALSTTVCWQSCLIKHLVTRTSGWFWDAALGDGWLCQPGQVGEGLRTSSWHSGRGRVLQRQCHWGEDWFSLRLVNWDWNHFRAEELWCSGRSWVSFTSFWTYCNTLTELMTPWQ